MVAHPLQRSWLFLILTGSEGYYTQCKLIYYTLHMSGLTMRRMMWWCSGRITRDQSWPVLQAGDWSKLPTL